MSAHIYFGQCCVFKEYHNVMTSVFFQLSVFVTDSSCVIFSILYFNLNCFDK